MEKRNERPLNKITTQFHMAIEGENILAVASLRFLDVETQQKTQQALLTYIAFSPAHVSTWVRDLW